MSITARFRVNRDRVVIEIPEKNITQTKPNVIFFDSQEKQILGIGESEETIRYDLQKQGKEVSDNLKFGASFQCDDEDSAFFDLMVIEYYMTDVYFAKTVIPVALDSIDYNFEIENYEKWDEQRKLKFEYTLQAKLKALTLKINGISKEMPIQKRRIEKVARLVKDLIPSLGLIGTLIFWSENVTSIFEFLLIFIGWGIIILLSIIAWGLIANTILPTMYLSIISPEFEKSREQKIVEFILNFYRKE